MEDKKEDSNSESHKNDNSENISSEDKTFKELGYLAKINENIFNPNEVSILTGDLKTREITQLVNFLCESYPLEAISYCLQRCYLNTFSKTSLLDKIIKYLLTKYEDSELIINHLLFAYKDNQLAANIINVDKFNSIKDNEGRQLTKLVFYDASKDSVGLRKFNMNEIFIEIDEIYIVDDDNMLKDINNGKDNIISLKETEDQANFLCEMHHLYKRFCKRGQNIFVFNFIGFETVKILRKKKKSNKKEEDSYDNSFAIFTCEQEGCKGRYKYNFNSNKFTEVVPHGDFNHKINENVPEYYKQNIDILKEKTHITDIQLVRKGKMFL